MNGIVNYEMFLQQAKTEVMNLHALEARRDQTELELRQDKKNLEAEKKATENEIRRVTKTKREEAVAEYDKEISKGQERLRKAKSKRETAKGKGVKDRIADETAQLRENNEEIMREIQALFKKNQVSALCNTKGYYALYYPHSLGEYLILFLTVAVCFLAVPGGLYLLLPVKHVIWLVLIYIGCFLLFGGLYVLVGYFTRDDHTQALRAGRQLRDQIHGNNKKIRKIKRSIRKDSNEEMYNLGAYDDEIAKIQQELSDAEARKEEALNTFETVTKNIISDEITVNHKAKIDELTALCNQDTEQLQGLEAEIQDKNKLLEERYTPQVGREFLTEARLDALMEILKRENITSLSEAIKEYRQTHA